MESTKVIVDYNNDYDALKNLQSGNFFIAKNEYGEISLFLYIDNDCIIDIEEGTKVDKDYFSQYEGINILKKIKITIEE